MGRVQNQHSIKLEIDNENKIHTITWKFLKTFSSISQVKEEIKSTIANHLENKDNKNNSYPNLGKTLGIMWKDTQALNILFFGLVINEN